MAGFQIAMKAALLWVTLMMLMTARTLAQDVCEFDGQVFASGDALPGDIITSRCGLATDYPCFCNPDLSGQIDCPYCGFATSSGFLRCARDGETVSFIGLDGVGQTCSCDASDPTDHQTSCETDPSAEICNIEVEDGVFEEYMPGDIITKVSRCGTTTAFPCTCNPNVGGQIDCPYCPFATRDGDGDYDLVCLVDAESAEVVGLDGVNRLCECFGPQQPGFPYTSECVAVSPTAPSTPITLPPLDAGETLAPSLAPVAAPTATDRDIDDDDKLFDLFTIPQFVGIVLGGVLLCCLCFALFAKCRGEKF